VAVKSHAPKVFHLCLSLLDWARTSDWEVACAGFLGRNAFRLQALPEDWARAVLLRLERTAALASAWTTRREGALGLARLALLSREPVRFEAYEALACLEVDAQLGVRDLASPALRLLDDVYFALNAGSLPGVDAKLVARARVVCGGALPQGFAFGSAAGVASPGPGGVPGSIATVEEQSPRAALATVFEVEEAL
jgi:hypothetical protein